MDWLGVVVAGDHIVARNWVGWSAAGAGDEGRDDAGGLAVEGASSSVVAHPSDGVKHLTPTRRPAVRTCFVGVVENLLCGSGHWNHLRYFGRAVMAWMMIGPSTLSITPTSSRLPETSASTKITKPSSQSAAFPRLQVSLPRDELRRGPLICAVCQRVLGLDGPRLERWWLPGRSSP